jgi:hypothetical protein
MPDDSGIDEQMLRAATAARRRALLLLAVAEFQHLFRRMSPWLHGLVGFALAMAFSMLIEQSRVLDGFEDAVVREVARQRELSKVIEPPQPHELQIQQLEISARMRVDTLEQRTDVRQVVERLGGVAPIQRGKLAALINDLSRELPPAAPASAPIVAIDIDLAPLEGGATSPEERTAMLDAIQKLRNSAHVIALVLPRAAGDGGREQRNAFMQAAECTRVAGKPASVENAEKGRNALFFASPRLFHPTGSYPTKYPYKLDSDDDGAAELPPFYPSLGTLIQLQFKHRFAHEPTPPAEMPHEAARQVLSARQTLTALCEQAHAARPDAELLEDRMATSASEKIAQAYKERRYSWRLLDDPRLQHREIDGGGTGSGMSSLGKDELTRPVLLLGIDGGASYDKFGIAGISPEPVSGATLHALQALSLELQPSLLLEKFAGIGMDILLAVVYSLIWFLIKPRLMSVRETMPVIGSWLVVGVPLGIGAALIYACFKVVAIGMGIDFWINPLYIVASLLLGIYVDAWSDSETGTDEERKLRHRLLGLPAARDALRNGFGQRVDGVRFAASSGYAPVTGMDELRVHAEVTRSRLGAAALADAVLSAVLRLVVLIAGWSFIVYEIVKVWRS